MLVTEPGALPDKHRRRNREFKNVKFLENMRLSILRKEKKQKKRKEERRKGEKTFLFCFSVVFTSSTECECIHDKVICFEYSLIH